MREEVDGVLGGRAPTQAALLQLPYTRMVLDETLRLYPSPMQKLRETIFSIPPPTVLPVLFNLL